VYGEGGVSGGDREERDRRNYEETAAGLRPVHRRRHSAARHRQLRDEPIAASGDRSDVAGLPRVVAEGPPQLRDSPRQDVRCHERLTPDRIQQFLFRYEPIGVFEQVAQDVEGLRLELDGCAVPRDDHAFEVHGHVGELIRHDILIKWSPIPHDARRRRRRSWRHG
jgi:hypothetical protein